ncbi:MAG: segregation/condensation protein A [Candidatus Dactylopiibacterium carminicum]|uniref:Segregation and condensation protein A n=1 Tax=Candidatus Dactylopiibacterium carminicum TaxID=857335 RepID=A0A272EUX9_9RHOO|nr:ScpA family protein [Candidatus Dactylopiibacterium carminicum]KAF7599807.1 segregation/condensation protein A [Candidatus Dactylopiibacterium carminicum]PAS93918.1 MAG: segregation/condensation protein A [Candidatus Dactylopiibacterium carminicum]PAS97233.1 MAG: segregation/condensation protein A [Candidatus Dactylopiibacterium carminicum]PAS99809.1 MAG: segregation/condensation protein A [Candidatus Dactylopiibacterium carminicum]
MLQVPQQGELVLARIHGEPLRELPTDLYIPPNALEVFLETFEGPLDLLLYLIRRANLDILDIPMAPLTAQYLVYVEAMRSSNLDLAADYLLMSATLLDIKSRMLLPRPPRETETEEEDPRAELVRRLMEYEQIKRGAQMLNGIPRVERDFEWVAVHVAEKTVERLPEVSLADLQTAWLALLQRARLHQHHRIQREELSVREHMTGILRRLQGAGDLPFEQLFELTHGVASLVVGFLAVLELCKERLVRVTQLAPMEPIYVRLNDATEPVPAV